MPRPCDLCSATDLECWDIRNGMAVLICQHCGLGRAEIPDSHWMARQGDYDQAYYEAMKYDARRNFRIRRARSWIAALSEVKPPPGNLLDIGCSTGYCLEAARQLGWTAYGTDVSPYAVEQSRQLGFKSFVSSYPDDFPQWLPPLDAVTASHVVEHLRDPFGYLRGLRQRMAPGGVLYLQLPNFQRILQRGPHVPYMGPPHHVFYFTLSTARQMLAATGWEVLPLPKLRPTYIGRRLWRWIPELLYHWPREAMRERNTLRGLLSNIHLLAQAKER